MTDSEVRWSPLCWLGGMGMQVVVSLLQKDGEGDFIHSKTHMYDVSFNIGKFRLIHYFLFHFKCQKAYIIVNLLKENIFFIFFSFLSVYADKKNC